MTILFLHGWNSVPGGVKPTFLAHHGYKVINPRLSDDDFDEALRAAQAEFDKHQPDVIVGSSRGGAVATNINSGDTPLVLLCPAWKRWGGATKVKQGTVILHSEADDVIPIADSRQLVHNSGLPASALTVVGSDHRLADPEPLETMLRACVNSCVPEWTDDAEELLSQEWVGLCYLATMRWITVAEETDWVVVHGTVLSNNDDKRIDHAWCERGQIVVDLARPIGARICRREQYYRLAKPEVRRVCSSDEALIRSLNGHHGPWDD